MSIPHSEALSPAIFGLSGPHRGVTLPPYLRSISPRQGAYVRARPRGRKKRKLLMNYGTGVARGAAQRPFGTAAAATLTTIALTTSLLASSALAQQAEPQQRLAQAPAPAPARPAAPRPAAPRPAAPAQ